MAINLFTAAVAITSITGHGASIAILLAISNICTDTIMAADIGSLALAAGATGAVAIYTVIGYTIAAKIAGLTNNTAAIAIAITGFIAGGTAIIILLTISHIGANAKMPTDIGLLANATFTTCAVAILAIAATTFVTIQAGCTIGFLEHTRTGGTVITAHTVAVLRATVAASGAAGTD